MIRPSLRRANIDRWIVSLTPMFEVISGKVSGLRLGEPSLTVGPSLVKRATMFEPDKIRKGAVWWLPPIGNVGFHVDFHQGGIEVEAWSGKDRRASVFVSGKVTDATLRRDLSVIFAAAGLSDLKQSDEIRSALFEKNLRPRTVPRE